MTDNIQNKASNQLKEGSTKGNTRQIASTTVRAEPPKPIKKPGK
jgi:hypothetical protein